MNRRDFERHLTAAGCCLQRHGARHDVWMNARTLAQTSVPRHPELKLGTIRAICKVLGIAAPAGR
jgi:predicted RNA binding protein YcfA (HicA-like mRNA interferase family)